MYINIPNVLSKDAIYEAQPTVALATFFKLAATWHLSRDESSILLGVSARTLKHYERTSKCKVLNRSTLERISLLINVWTDLRSLFRSSDDAIRWLHTNNVLFGNMTPLERMLAGNVTDIEIVRQNIAYAITT